MTLEALLAEIVGLLDAAGIPHMVAGSVASSHHGEPRMTQDIDLVIAPTAGSLVTFVASLDTSRFYVGDARRAFEQHDVFNVIAVRTGWKVDLIVIKDRPFSRSEFDRRVPVVLAGVPTAIATVEDTVLAKLEWGEGVSERQQRDVAAMLATQRGAVDLGYLRRWAPELGVAEALERALLDAGG